MQQVMKRGKINTFGVMTCLLNVIIVILLVPSAKAHTMQVFHSVLSPEECGLFSTSYPTNEYTVDGQEKGFVHVPAHIIDRINGALLCGEDSENCSTDELGTTTPMTLQTSYLPKSSAPHRDIYHDEDGNPQMHKGRVAFIFLNDNEKAHFRHGQEDYEVKAGSMLVFRGDIVHHTIIQAGIVNLLGPFVIPTFETAGPGGVHCPDCGVASIASEPNIVQISLDKIACPREDGWVVSELWNALHESRIKFLPKQWVLCAPSDDGDESVVVAPYHLSEGIPEAWAGTGTFVRMVNVHTGEQLDSFDPSISSIMP